MATVQSPSEDAPSQLPSPTPYAVTESDQGGGQVSGPSESAACRSCQAANTACDKTKPSCKPCRDEGVQCEYMESSRAGPDDVFILVIGFVGAGKSSFINRCVGSKVLQVGQVGYYGLRSVTQFVAEAVFELDGKRIHLIDTPGFVIRTRGWKNIWIPVASWLAAAYGIFKVDSAIYTHCIFDNGQNSIALRHLSSLRDVGLFEDLSKVAYVTTMWDKIDQKTGEAKERVLSRHKLKSLVSATYRDDGTRASALRVIRSLSSGERLKSLQIRRELVDETRLLDPKEAGRAQIERQDLPLAQGKVDLNGSKKSFPVYHPTGVGSSSSSIPERGMLLTSHDQQVEVPDNWQMKPSLDTSHSDDAADGFKSNLARKQSRSRASSTRTPKHEARTGNAENSPGQLSRRAVHEERVAIRAEIHRTSLHTLRRRLLQYASDGVSGEQIYKELKSLEKYICTPVRGQSSGTVQSPDFEAQSPKFPIDKVLQAVRSDENLRYGLGTNTDLINHWLYSRFWLCRNSGIVVFRNCCRLQTAHIADDFLSVLVPADSWSHHGPCVVSLRRIQIADIGALLYTLADCIRDVFKRGSHILSGQTDIQLLVDCFHDVHVRSEKLLASIDLKDSLTSISAIDLKREIEKLYAGEPPHSKHLLSIFARCRYAFQALDLVILTYEGAHVSDLEDLPHSSQNKHMVLLDEVFPTIAEPSESPATYLQCLPMKCLAPLLGNRDVWVFTNTMLNFPTALYLKTDIETFADVWGPVWRVKDQHEPDKTARYNVGEGAIIPWPFDPVVHPALATNERLCHWRSHFDFINNDASSIDTDSSSTSSEAGEAPTEDAISGKFDGFEILVIGAELGPRLQWSPCRCSVDDLKQQLKEAGRLDHMLALKSYRYVDSQQTSLIVGSHGVQAGRSKVFKDMKEEPLKIALVAVWENEPELRNPREFENFWGVVVSLCTMNARRVRLVELLGESSVIGLLDRFQWSDLDANENSERRHSFIGAVSSADPRALGNLWGANPSWREELGKALLICLRVLSKTGYNINRDEFHMLWLPNGCHRPRRVTLRPTDQSWFKLLKDTTYSMTTAVIVEDSLGEKPPCSRDRSAWFTIPSVLETALCINRNLRPTLELKKTRARLDEAHWISRTDARKWKHVWNVSGLARGKYLWVGSEDRLEVLRPLSDWSLLLAVDIVKRALFRETLGIRPSERVSHWEYTNEEDESIDIHPIPVHII